MFRSCHIDIPGSHENLKSLLTFSLVPNLFQNVFDRYLFSCFFVREDKDMYIFRLEVDLQLEVQCRNISIFALTCF